MDREIEIERERVGRREGESRHLDPHLSPPPPLFSPTPNPNPPPPPPPSASSTIFFSASLDGNERGVPRRLQGGEEGGEGGRERERERERENVR